MDPFRQLICFRKTQNKKIRQLFPFKLRNPIKIKKPECGVKKNLHLSMGCVSSKLFRKDLRQEIVFGNGGSDSTHHHHVVSLTSSTYGVLNLDKTQHQKQPIIKDFATDSKRSKKSPVREEPPEVINAWELMEGLEEEAPVSIPSKRSPKTMVFLRGFGDLDTGRRSPLKFLNHMASPKKLMRSGGGGKENNKGLVNRFRWDYSPKGAFKSRNLPDNSMRSRRCSFDSGGISRRSLGPLFDPELLESFEKELSVEEEEQIKKMVFSTPVSRTKRNSNSTRDCDSILDSFEKKFPNRCENAVFIYTTTLRGIRKTFEDCNTVRSIVESHGIQVFERDVSMDSGFKEELRGIMGKKEVKVPVVFVKGRLIGGAEEVVRLEEEGKLGILLNGIPRAAAACDGCAGIRFVMCLECSGSCKVVGEDGRKTVKCGECNENGLIQCPICC